MARYRVAKPAPLGDETIEADRCHIDASGALTFRRLVIEPPYPDRTELVQAFASGRWVEVLRVEDTDG